MKTKLFSFCPICGQQKAHYRLLGYRCPKPEHEAQEHRRDLQLAKGGSVLRICPHCKESVYPQYENFCPNCGDSIEGENHDASL